LSAKNDFRDAQMHVHKSGGRQPAVLGSAKVGGQKGLRYMLVPERGDLSQPAVVWENRPSRDGSGCLTDSRWNMLRNHPALTEVFARLAYVSRSWCTVSVCRTKRQPQCTPNFSAKNHIRGAETHVHKSGGREPAVVFQTAYAGAMR
jgi:hypothetical protein